MGKAPYSADDEALLFFWPAAASTPLAPGRGDLLMFPFRDREYRSASFTRRLLTFPRALMVDSSLFWTYTVYTGSTCGYVLRLASCKTNRMYLTIARFITTSGLTRRVLQSLTRPERLNKLLRDLMTSSNNNMISKKALVQIYNRKKKKKKDQWTNLQRNSDLTA